MKKSGAKKPATTGITDNLKKGITEMLVLAFFSKADMTINDIVRGLDDGSEGKCKITFPYSTVYKLLEKGYIVEGEKRVADNRRRQFYRITAKGKRYFAQMRCEYESFISGVDMIFSSLAE